MDLECSDYSASKPRKWYNRYSFPLIPMINKISANKYNTSSFSFHWLFLKVWTLNTPAFELAFVMDTHWGIGITAIIPYLRIVFCIPCSYKVDIWVNSNFSRKPK